MMANRITLRLSWLFVKFCYYLLPCLALLFKITLWLLGAIFLFVLFIFII